MPSRILLTLPAAQHLLESASRGVSAALSTCFSLQDRLALLCVHGLVHLLGYDHETEQDFEQMVAVEERVLQEAFMMQDGETAVGYRLGKRA